MIIRGFTTAGTGEKLTPFPCGPGGSGTDTDDQQATEVPYDNSGSGLTADDVQEAIDELAAQVAACCTPGADISSGELLSTGEVGGSDGDDLYPAFTAFVPGDFTQQNFGGSSVTSNANGGQFFRAPANAGTSIRQLIKTVPTAPYTITIGFFVSTVGVNFQACGLMIRQNSDGKIITYALESDGGKTAFEVSRYNSETSFNSSSSRNTNYAIGAIVYLRMTDDNTNRKFYFSTNGHDWILLHSEGRTSFATASHIGVFVNTETGSYDAGMDIRHYVES